MSDRVALDLELQRAATCSCEKPWCYLSRDSVPISVLFLDIDGVLNCRYGWKRDNPQTYKYMTKECVLELGRVLAACPDAVICVSSTWRRYHSITELRSFMGQFGIPGERIVSRTIMRFSDGVRGHEIQDWLDEHSGVVRFAIVDDDNDMAHLMPHLIQTSSDVGLTREKADRLISKLGGAAWVG